MPWQDLRTAREGGNGFDLRFGACAVAVSLGVGRLWPRNPLTGSARSVAFPRVSRLDCDAARSGLPGSLCGRQCDVRVLAAKRPGRHKNRAPALLPWKYFVTITRRRFCGFASFCSEIAPVEVFLRFAPGRSRAYSGPLRPATAPIESVTKWPERSRGSQVSPWCFLALFAPPPARPPEGSGQHDLPGAGEAELLGSLRLTLRRGLRVDCSPRPSACLVRSGAGFHSKTPFPWTAKHSFPLVGLRWRELL